MTPLAIRCDPHTPQNGGPGRRLARCSSSGQGGVQLPTLVLEVERWMVVDEWSVHVKASLAAAPQHFYADALTVG